MKNENSGRQRKTILGVLLAIILIGLTYMMFSMGSHEKYYDPSGTSSYLNDSMNLGLDDDSVANKITQEGLPELSGSESEKKVEKEEKKSEADKEDSSFDGESTTEGATTAAPVVEEPAPTVKNVKVKKVIEDIKTGPSEEATISE